MTEYICSEGCSCEGLQDGTESRLMRMVFFAHREVLFEKIKQKIEEKEGKKLEQIAELLAEASEARMKAKQETERKQEETGEKLRDIFGR